jgi:hypothetical protein
MIFLVGDHGFKIELLHHHQEDGKETPFCVCSPTEDQQKLNECCRRTFCFLGRD